MYPKLTMRQKHYPSFCICIYCLNPFPPDQLTDEHIIPYALNGTLVIEKAACESCRDRSNRVYEEPALNADFLVPRLLMEMKRRKKAKPKRFPLVSLGGGIHAKACDFDVELKAAEYPPLFQLLVLPIPGRLADVDRGSTLSTLQHQIYHLPKTWEAERFQSGITTRTAFAHTAFSTTLAKIAYCFAVAECGLNTYDFSELRELLLGKRDDVYNFVGSRDVTSGSTDWHLHDVRVVQHSSFLTVHVHLFASCRLRPYEVVVAKMPPKEV
jgi:hypothetical protein